MAGQVRLASRETPIYDPGVQLGKLLRTAFLANLFVNAGFRRELRRMLKLCVHARQCARTDGDNRRLLGRDRHMVRRLAVVVWWIGLLVGLALLGAGAARQIAHRSCGDLLSAQADANRLREAHDAAVDAELPKKGPPSDPYDRALGVGAYGASASAVSASPLDQALAIRAQGGSVVAPPLSAEVIECPSYNGLTSAFLGGVGVVFTLIAWALTYVLGGSFLLPPRPLRWASDARLASAHVCELPPRDTHGPHADVLRRRA